MNKRILWKALDGREFIIDCEKLNLKDMEQVYAHIAELRELHNTGEPTFMSAAGDVPNDGSTVDINSLSPDIQEKVKETIAEASQKPDPKKMN